MRSPFVAGAMCDDGGWYVREGFVYECVDSFVLCGSSTLPESAHEVFSFCHGLVEESHVDAGSKGTGYVVLLCG